MFVGLSTQAERYSSTNGFDQLIQFAQFHALYAHVSLDRHCCLFRIILNPSSRQKYNGTYSMTSIIGAQQAVPYPCCRPIACSHGGCPLAPNLSRCVDPLGVPTLEFWQRNSKVFPQPRCLLHSGTLERFTALISSGYSLVKFCETSYVVCLSSSAHLPLH